ncbi:conserved hypothetical protein [Ricinus communis]|uniref:Uncharacterized protein n=1 Tax=Ricinus communis TaxID=3988 RepID=B9T6A9_RICCO|nr:conserved hypothetical protein [Ricinus communis]
MKPLLKLQLQPFIWQPGRSSGINTMPDKRKQRMPAAMLSAEITLQPTKKQNGSGFNKNVLNFTQQHYNVACLVNWKVQAANP